MTDHEERTKRLMEPKQDYLQKEIVESLEKLHSLASKPPWVWNSPSEPLGIQDCLSGVDRRLVRILRNNTADIIAMAKKRLEEME